MAGPEKDDVQKVMTKLLEVKRTGDQMLAALKDVQEHFRQYGEVSRLTYKVDVAVERAEASVFGRSM